MLKMLKNRAYVLGVLLLYVASAIPEYAQRRLGQKPEESISATAPIDPTATQLKPQYRGINPGILYSELERRSNESKGEFETTQAFNERMTKLQGRPLIGTISKDSLIPFTLASENTMLNKVTSRYDADKGVLAVSIEMTAPVVGVRMDLDKRSVPLRYDFQPSTSYVGQNAYGAKVTIEKTFANVYELLIENFRDFERVPRDSSLTFRHTITANLEMTPAEAMAAKPNLKVLALARLHDPYILKGYLSHKPTVSEPRDTFAVYHYLVCEVKEFWIYDYASGRIYAKWRP
jgi:hypothetical protein